MTIRFVLLLTVMCFNLADAQAQVTRFEFDHPDAILLDAAKVDWITSSYWRIYRDDISMRGNYRTTEKNISIAYRPDGSLFYNGHECTWTVLDGKVIDHRLADKEVSARLNFGGMFVVTAMDATTIVLSKMLTSSNDMERVIYLRSSPNLTLLEQPKHSMFTNRDKPLTEEEIQELAKMTSDELFHSGYNVRNGALFIHALDTIQTIQLAAYRAKNR